MSIQRSNITTISCSTAHTKGSWTEMLASLSANTKEIVISMLYSNAGSTAFLFDIGIGGAGAETPIINNVIYAPSPDLSVLVMPIPIGIAAGSRISARCQASVTAARSLTLAIEFISGTSSAVVTTIGADTANTKGVTIDPGASAGTKGSYSELTASLGVNAQVVNVAVSGKANTAPVGATFELDIATGAGGAEAVQIPDIPFISLAPGAPIGTWQPVTWPFNLAIPSGTRIAARAKSTITDATDRLFDVVLYVSSGLPSSGGEHSAVF
jgi:hypothetical protein